ncbi:MAG TPA: hypothetical protein VKV95_10385 [Terriglobia bacterium]|nr:hypothetical protein [Terriglobia bacterium]
MGFVQFTLAVLGLGLEAALILRARQGRYLSHFPFFYSYLSYVFVWTIFTLMFFYFMPQLYPYVYWFSYSMMLLAEFAVLFELSDHIFRPYPGIRRLGQLLTGAVCLAFLLVYIIPALWRHQPSSIAFFELEKRTSLTKVVLIIVLLLVARSFRISFSRNISGMMLGFAIYLAASIANVALAEGLGRARYATIFSLVSPLAYFLALSIWTAALWRYEPVLPNQGNFSRGGDNFSEPLSVQLGRYSSELSRRFRR